MKLWKIFRYEFAYLAGRLSTQLYFIVLFLFTLIMNGLTTPGDGVYANNTFHITATVVIGALLWLVMGASITGEAAARDVQVRMHHLTYTTPVTKLHYLGGRFLAALVVNALLVLSLPVGVLFSFHLFGMDEGGLLPFRPSAYFNVYFLLALPTVFIATALQFGFAALSRQVMTSYLASLLLAIFAQVFAIAAATLFGDWDLVKLLDPVGVTGILGNELQTWTPTEKNTRLVSLQGFFLWNRVLWSAAAVLLLWLTYTRFSFSHVETKSWWSRFLRQPKPMTKTLTENFVTRATAISIPQVEQTFGYATGLRQVLTIAGSSFTKIAKHPAGLLLVGVLALASALFGSRILTQFGIPLLPTTSQVLHYLATPLTNLGTPWLVMPLLLMYFVGELVWRERAAGINDLTDTAPVPDWVLFTGKFLGFGLVVLVWMVFLLAGGIGMQLGMGYHQLEIGLYLQVLFGLQLVDYLLFALLSFAIHVVVNQKSIAHLLVLLVFGFMAFPSAFQVEHNLLIFGAGPEWNYTDMRGFGQTLGPWLHFKLYWLAWALLLAVAARMLWPRGREQGLLSRIKLAPKRFNGSTAWVASIGLILLFAVGSFIFYNTNVLNEYVTVSESLERQAAYERQYSRYRNAPQPQLTATKLHVEIYPDKQQADINATYTLVNRESLPIDTIHIGSGSGFEPVAIRFNQVSIPVVEDKKLGHYMYALQKPLQPGDSLQLNFAVHYHQRGFQQKNNKALVVEGGTYFTNFDLLPVIGYQSYREIRDAVLRKKYLPAAKPAMPSLYDTAAQKKPFSTTQSSLEAVIGTTKGEVAVAPGAFQQTWTKGDRRYFHYKTEGSIGGEFAILSGKYTVKEESWNNIAIKLYYHPDHAQNTARMLRSVKASLAYYTESFGAYPYHQFTLVERAGTVSGATADAGIVYYGEQYPLLNPDDSPEGFDLPYYILAHEVAHQWWGMARLSPANVEGAGVLIEGLSVYAGMQVLEKAYGKGHLQKYVDYLHSSYEMPRSLSTTSLLRANEDFLYYRKGGLAMHALSRYVGKDKINGALRALLQKQASGALRHPTTLHLYEELQKVTPDSLHYLLHDLFKENTYWRLKTKGIAAAKTGDGNWQVKLKVEAQKVIVDATGMEHNVPMNDWLEVGLYEEGKRLHEPLYLQMHRIGSGEQTISITVPRKPGHGGIDPNHLLIDLRRDDNVKYLAD